MQRKQHRLRNPFFALLAVGMMTAWLAFVSPSLQTQQAWAIHETIPGVGIEFADGLFADYPDREGDENLCGTEGILPVKMVRNDPSVEAAGGVAYSCCPEGTDEFDNEHFLCLDTDGSGFTFPDDDQMTPEEVQDEYIGQITDTIDPFVFEHQLPSKNLKTALNILAAALEGKVITDDNVYDPEVGERVSGELQSYVQDTLIQLEETQITDKELKAYSKVFSQAIKRLSVVGGYMDTAEDLDATTEALNELEACGYFELNFKNCT